MASVPELTSVTIRGLREATRRRARVEAARKGRSMEAELRDLIERTFGEEPPARDPDDLRTRLPGEDLVDHLIRITRPGIDWDLPAREVSPGLRTDFSAD